MNERIAVKVDGRGVLWLKHRIYKPADAKTVLKSVEPFIVS